MNPWIAPALIAAVLVLGALTYVAIRWRRAPAAFRAMNTVAGICFVAGFLAGVWAFHLTGSRSAPATSPHAPSGPSPSSAPAGSVPASEVGKAIVEMDEKHAGDPMWVSSASTAEMCNEGLIDTNSLL